MKVGILCASSINKFNSEVFNHIANSKKGMSLFCIMDERPRKTDYQRNVANLKSWRGTYVLSMSVYKLFRRENGYTNTESFCTNHNIPVQKISDPVSNDFLNVIKSQEFDILVHLNGFDGAIGKPLLDLLPLGVLAYHHGDLREYRGQPPAFWELYYGESTMVSTIQKLNEWVDSGLPILERDIPVYKTDTLQRLLQRLYSNTPDMMAQALSLYAQGKPEPAHLVYHGTLYEDPTIIEWIVLQYRIYRRKSRNWFSQLANKQFFGFDVSELKIRDR